MLRGNVSVDIHTKRTNFEVRLKIVIPPEVVLLELGPQDGWSRTRSPLYDPVALHNL